MFIGNVPKSVLAINDITETTPISFLFKKGVYIIEHEHLLSEVWRKFRNLGVSLASMSTESRTTVTLLGDCILFSKVAAAATRSSSKSENDALCSEITSTSFSSLVVFSKYLLAPLLTFSEDLYSNYFGYFMENFFGSCGQSKYTTTLSFGKDDNTLRTDVDLPHLFSPTIIAY